MGLMVTKSGAASRMSTSCARDSSRRFRSRPSAIVRATDAIVSSVRSGIGRRLTNAKTPSGRPVTASG
jgi:hypothetical protein